MNRRFSALLLVTLALGGCRDACEPADDPTVTLGEGVGGAFAAFEDGQEVGLQSAPQGGFGVSVVVATDGLFTEERTTAAAQLDIFRGDELEGTFESVGLQLLCAGPSEGGRIHGQVVGLDPAEYPSNDSLLGLDGELVRLSVSVTDAEGNVATGSTEVTLDIGG